MNFTLHQLRVFAAVTEHQSVTKAAESLFMTQPAVSIQLKHLQDQFDVPLTEVIGRKIHITDAGEELAILAKEILGNVDEIQTKMSALRGVTAGKLKLAVVSTGKYFMPHFISEYHERYEEVKLFVDVSNRRKVLSSLQSNDVDFAVVSILPDLEGIEYEEIMPNPLYVVSGTNSNVPYKKYYEPQDLEEIPFIFREEGSGTRTMLEKYIAENNINPKVMLELTTNEAVKQAIMAGLGVSVISAYSMRLELKNDELKILPVKGYPLVNTWYLVWLKGKKFSPASSAFLDFIRSEKERIYEDKFADYFIEKENYQGTKVVIKD
ncbi:LysR family transcriptional regulator [Mangrovivirga sp. M17]|uniref:LysR family transcriptional regulator n=1 Tax=Mangrovivirga halotolerans TaxID=2993936 RepID=A0ABT3RND4_9BACT|nr:LysR family transcriptional regulator [Mangrovivirga halotolerans]MCX2742660.1 LysR family transcriptional regulator [Mangrovivirga halotolerans]